MGGADVHDQHCCKLLPALSSKKWTLVIFLRLVQAAITNATVLYNICGKSKKAGTKDSALSISRDYMNVSNTSREKKETSVKHEKFAQKSTKFCSNNCGIRTVNYCTVCKLYFCKKCFEMKHQSM